MTERAELRWVERYGTKGKRKKRKRSTEWASHELDKSRKHTHSVANLHLIHTVWAPNNHLNSDPQQTPRNETSPCLTLNNKTISHDWEKKHNLITLILKWSAVCNKPLHYEIMSCKMCDFHRDLFSSCVSLMGYKEQSYMANKGNLTPACVSGYVLQQQTVVKGDRPLNIRTESRSITDTWLIICGWNERAGLFFSCFMYAFCKI